MMLDQDMRKWFANYFGSKVRFDEPMSKHTYFKVGGPAEVFVAPESIEQLAELILWSVEKNVPYIVAGDGSNLLVSDKGIKGIVIVLTKCLNRIFRVKEEKESVIIKAMAGTRTQELCRFAIDEGLSGLNFALGIPGTVGGAIMMNAGTSTGTISDILESVNVMAASGDILKIEKADIDFSYRSLIWKRKINISGNEDPVILEGTFRLGKSDTLELKKEAQVILKKRNESQPTGLPCAGCFFKNPTSGKTAGQLIDMAGLKGTRIGGSNISERHANFIVNTGNASASDILALMQLVQNTVFEKFNINLQPEVKIVGI
ncbi:UDP-N-acetylmuramate dehydrogenase [Desulfobacterium sp. N47]|uniref:UDP-N-acetylenolpyruvoylglucosamine reductase n=1 Tax=uncultured Desulfobacterium sp. TaxID=201089 RepID=E1YBV6_9BACT|nr:UDP-N-acetylenolpyruvoylglucosamine reductase [uncultured Desulfobacterium sp.]